VSTVSHHHDVQLYESDDLLVRAVADHLAPAVIAGGVAVGILGRRHRDLVLQAVVDAGVDEAVVAAGERFVLLDAATTLESFMVAGRPNASLFRAVVGDSLRSLAAKADGPVAAFGEMVALLWLDGHVEAALELEDLWNELAGELSFGLLCAYPQSLFPEPGPGLDAVRDRHRELITES
jgi:hypothetical protein